MKLFFKLLFTLFISSCNNKTDSLIRIEGEAQGTTYHISFLSRDNLNYKQEIDSLLKDLDKSLSTYVPTSIISRINKNDTTAIPDNYFKEVFNKATEISERTEGIFDVTIGPVINAWGFGFTKKEKVSKSMIDSLLKFVGYKMVRLTNGKLQKTAPQIMLDFNALAQGYSVDVIAAYLESKGIENYMVELGGEVKARGKKTNNEYWKIGIDQPNDTTTIGRPLQAIIRVKDRALATSGNYRKFYVEDGQRLSHIIHPQTGYPAKHNLLSATVLADDCMTADAYATAFMVMGLEKSKQFLNKNKNLKLDVHFIYHEKGSWKTYTSETLKDWIEELN